MNQNNESGGILQIGHIEIDPKLFNSPADSSALPILPTRNLVLFPGVSIPINILRESSLKIAQLSAEKHIPVGIVCQQDASCDNPTSVDELYPYGVIADIFHVLELPDGSHTAIVRARQRFKILAQTPATTVPNAITAEVKLLRDTHPSRKSLPEFEDVMQNITRLACDTVDKTSDDKAFANAIKMIENLEDRLNFIATNFPAEAAEKIEVLKKGSMLARAEEMLSVILLQQDRMKVYDDILTRAKSKMNENQRNAFLQSQLDAIKEELYGTPDDSDDFEKLYSMLVSKQMPGDVRTKAEAELQKLRRYNPSSPDYSVQFNYLDTLLKMPWTPSETPTDIRKARQTLDSDHYGLTGVKQRILEQIAVMINNPRVKAPILCLVGPPGVGKTSLGQSVARALGRVYQRVALGGVHDETEIRGHRRTYIGAMPGRIVKALESAGCNNSVLLLDEIDKLGKSMHGDPGAALLEVLDPEQNSTFHDNFLEVPYDLSGVFFIATANSLASVPTPLLDRMEIIELPPYTTDEKVEIAKRHLLPKALINNGLGLDGEGFAISDRGIRFVISEYTGREAGVRQLEKVLGSLIRKKILAKLTKEDFPSPLNPIDIERLLGDTGKRTFGRVGFSTPAH